MGMGPHVAASNEKYTWLLRQTCVASLPHKARMLYNNTAIWMI